MQEQPVLERENLWKWGTVLMPGEEFSAYTWLTPFTVENGYASAGSYANGQVVDTVGGGACQICTTLYNAALLAEMDITQRQNHSMIVTYVPASQDSAIAGTYKDLKFKNPYDTPIYMEGAEGSGRADHKGGRIFEAGCEGEGTVGALWAAVTALEIRLRGRRGDGENLVADGYLYGIEGNLPCRSGRCSCGTGGSGWTAT